MVFEKLSSARSDFLERRVHVCLVAVVVCTWVSCLEKNKTNNENECELSSCFLLTKEWKSKKQKEEAKKKSKEKNKSCLYISLSVLVVGCISAFVFLLIGILGWPWIWEKK